MTKVTEWVLKFREDVRPQMDRVGKTFTNSYDKLKKVETELKKDTAEIKKFGHEIEVVDKKLSNVLKPHKFSIDRADVKALSKDLDTVNKQIVQIENTAKRVSTTTGSGGVGGGRMFGKSNFSQAFNQSSLGGMMPLITNPYMMGGAAIAAGSRFMYDNGKLHLNYDREFAKINATAQLEAPALRQLRGEVMAMGKNSTAELSTVPAAFEKILSATNNVPLSKQILRASLIGSQAGFADVNDVASSTVGIMNAVGAKNTNANEVLDVLFASKRQGVGEFKDFANYLPSVITQGTALGYNYKDVAGTFSYLTTKGYGADRSNMLLSNAFTALGKPEVLKDLKKYGIDTYGKDHKRLPLGSIIGQLEGKLNGLPQDKRDAMMGDIIKDSQAKEAFNALVKDTKLLQEMMLTTRNSAGEMNAALSKTANGLNELQQLDNNWEMVKDNLGKALAPALVGLFERINTGLDGVIKHQGVNNMTTDEQIAFRAKEYMYDLRTGRREDFQGQIDGNKAGLIMSLRAKGIGEEEITKQLNYYTTLAKMPVNSKAGYMLKYGLAENPFGGNANLTPTPVNNANSSLSATMDNISGGGNIKNFTVNIATMKTADTIKLNGSGKEDVADMENDFLDMFLRVVQGLELSAGGAD